MPRQQYQSGAMDYSPPAAPEPNTWMAALNAQSQNTQLTQTVGDLRVELTTVNLQYRQLQSDFDALERDYNSLRDERADLLNEVQRLQRQLADAKAQRAGSEQGDDDHPAVVAWVDLYA
ncbi:uncharacterized protein TRAVEDRAFT_48055 [Trametes versicolor FP-101664 SS1]|uniref:uncharacterized protein n=1 Tax=Trametes versicolor (strain FP-101664) TaxID=717944 RepID=UPI0004623DE4|nr:uncharacterized protein TRAVEDRAFT_48055 [Trametes versicolor FP-101664 SS1]EIW58913.1 hypothetical protein TRAVEDRAFT_48055 [Trametes versicolor FP-101664 SS1]